MDTINNPYNPQPQFQQPPMPGMMPQMPPRGQWQRRAMNAIGRVNNIFFPKWLTQYGAVVYLLALAVVSFMYSTYSLPWYYWLSGLVSIIVFFYYGAYLTNKSLSLDRVRRQWNFEKKIFWIAFIPRVVWMLLIYTIFIQNYGDAFGFESGDPTFYDYQAKVFSQAISDGNYFSVWKNTSEIIDISDLGYASYIGFVYWLTDNSIIAVRFIKCILSAFTVLLIYRLAKRNFDPRIARVAAIFCALWPNFWYYCGCHLKEVEMVFLSVLFVEQADQMLRSRQFTAWKVIPILLIASVIFTFRTPLGIVALLSLVFGVVMSSAKVINWGKRIVVGLLAIALIVVVAGNRIEEQSRNLFEQVQKNEQHTNMEWRGEREHGNALAKYAGATVFAPMIFTLPFPSMVKPFEGQDVQQLLNGGNFIKNIISFFTILALIMIFLSGKWRDYLLPLSFMLGYLLVLTMSSFAQSERFHQPVMPFELMFAAYGLSIAVTKAKYKRWFTYWCAIMFVAVIAWNWFKMAGRGLS